MQRTHGVRGRVDDTGRGVEHDRTVTHARSDARVGHATAEGEGSGRDHPREAVEEPEIGALQFARLAPGAARPFPGEHRDHSPLVTHGDGRHAALVGDPGDGDVTLDDPVRLDGAGEQRTVGIAHADPDEVGDVDGLPRRGAHLGHHDPVALSRPHVQEEVGEAEVGEHAPFAHQVGEVADLLLGEIRVLTREFTDGRHVRPSLPPSLPPTTRAP